MEINSLHISIMGVVLTIALVMAFLKRKRRKLIEEILKDKNFWKEETRIKISSSKITIKNYKKIESENLEDIPKILEEETGERFRLKREANKIMLIKFENPPKRKGVHFLNLENGKYKNFSIGELKNWNGLFVCGESGTGKSVLVKELIKNKNTIIYSPKGNEDFKEGKPFGEEAIKEIRKLIDNYKELKEETILIIDEVISFIALSKQVDKAILKDLSVLFTINRSSNLKIILISQKLNKEADLDISLLNYKIINHKEIGNFKSTLGISRIKTNIQSLKVGQFLIFTEEGEGIISNVI